MREIKFRGKRVDNGEWAYGYYDGCYETTTINYLKDGIPYNVCVISDTVGEYTGLHNKNGKEVYEGDIVKRTCELIGAPDDDFTGIVKFECSAFLLESFDGRNGRYLWDDVQELEVIGNIYDNSELLQEVNK